MDVSSLRVGSKVRYRTLSVPSVARIADPRHFDVCGAEEIAGDGASPEQSSRRVW